MVSTPVQKNQTLSVTYGTDGSKIASGRTTPGLTNWQVFEALGIYVDVDTSAAGFTTTPVYVTSIGGEWTHWETTGASAVYQASAKGFRVYIRWDKASETQRQLSPAYANGQKWHINWTAIEPSTTATIDIGSILANIPYIKTGETSNGYLQDSTWELNAGSGERTYTTAVKFDSPFRVPPKVSLALSGQDAGASTNIRIQLIAKNITVDGFDLAYTTWSDTVLFSASAAWTAIGLKP